MYYIRQHIRDIIAAYEGTLPLTHFLKKYFKQHPKLGSRDRKILSEVVYAFYRFAHGVPAAAAQTDTLADIAILLSGRDNPHLRQLLPVTWQPFYGLAQNERLAWLAQQGLNFDIGGLFPEGPVFSAGISREEWLQSMLRQPALFICVPEKYMKTVTARLTEAGIGFEKQEGQCIALDNGSPVDKILEPHSYRVQDASSQQTGRYFRVKEKESCWDCCSGAGGKSLLLKELQPQVRLTVSDVRASILQNLAERFRMYGYTPPEQLQLSAADERQTKELLGKRQFDQIICDVPCTGSGTWSRTPEQLYFFNTDTIKDFAARQKSIGANVLHYLKPGGTMVYITCSVFAEENEQVVAHLLASGTVEVQEQRLINGTGNAADSMFVATLVRKVS